MHYPLKGADYGLLLLYKLFCSFLYTFIYLYTYFILIYIYSEKEYEGEYAFEAEKRNKMRTVFVTGKDGLTPQEAAIILVQEARMLVQVRNAYVIICLEKL